MASVCKDKSGWRILFVDQHGDRKQLRPGKGTNKATAEQLGWHIDALVGVAASGGVMPRQTALWLPEIGGKLRSKLEQLGLVEPLAPVEPVDDTPQITLHDWTEQFIADATTSHGKPASESTITTGEQPESIWRHSSKVPEHWTASPRLMPKSFGSISRSAEFVARKPIAKVTLCH